MASAKRTRALVVGMAVLTTTACGGATALDDFDLEADGGEQRSAGVTSNHGLAPGDAGARFDGRDQALDATGAGHVACAVTEKDRSFAATDPLGACSEGQNTDHRPGDEGVTSGVAWEYVPAHDIDVTRLELVVSGGGVALFDSDGDHPGEKLFEGAFTGGAWQWRGVDVDPPIHLLACHPYYIEQDAPADGGDYVSATAGGTQERQFDPPGFAPDPAAWQGPYFGVAWTARIIGTCP
jgi:hypothetical protein